VAFLQRLGVTHDLVLDSMLEVHGCSLSVAYPADGRVGADQGVVQFDLQESLEDECRETTHGATIPERGKGFGNGERSHFVECGEEANPVSKRASIEAIAEEVFSIAEPVAVGALLHGNGTVAVPCPFGRQRDPVGRPRKFAGDVDAAALEIGAQEGEA